MLVEYGFQSFFSRLGVRLQRARGVSSTAISYIHRHGCHMFPQRDDQHAFEVCCRNTFPGP